MFMVLAALATSAKVLTHNLPSSVHRQPDKVTLKAQ